MENRQIMRRCQEMVNALDIPQPFNLTEFCARLEKRRGRAIKLIQIEAAPGAPCGMWVAARTTDYIFHVCGKSPLHRQQIVLHELGHLVFDHRGGPWEDTALGRLLPDLDPALIEKMLSRVAYSTTEELEAETFADLVSLKLRKPSGQPRDPDLPPEMAEVVARIERALSGAQSPPGKRSDENPPDQDGV